MQGDSPFSRQAFLKTVPKIEYIWLFLANSKTRRIGIAGVQFNLETLSA
jgi:hypothetical protein